MIEKYFRGISDEGMPLFFVCYGFLDDLFWGREGLVEGCFIVYL